MSGKINWDRIKQRDARHQRGTLCVTDEKEFRENDAAEKWLAKQAAKANPREVGHDRYKNTRGR
jgi:hypothetical protein